MSQTHDEQHDEFEEDSRKGNGTVRVTVEYVNTSESQHFRMPRTATLREVFAKAYEVLGEKPQDGDQFSCKDGKDLMPYLDLTLEQTHRKGICRARHYQIVGQTGGA
jgi:hypothetical protein